MIAFLIGDLAMRGGTHKQFLKLLQYAVKEQVDFFVITLHLDFDKTYPEFRQFADRIQQLPTSPRSNRCARIKQRLHDMYILRKWVSKADVVNIHDNGFDTMLPAFVGKKVVWQVNDLPPYFHQGAHKQQHSTFFEHLHRVYLRLFLPIVNDFTVNVTKNAMRIKDLLRRSAHVFYCGIEPINIPRHTEESIARMRQRRINLLSSGVVLPYRNYETQVSVVKRLREEGIDAHLNIIGALLDRDYAQRVQQLIDEQQLSEYIHFCGMVDEATFQSLHAQADCFLFINIDQSWGLAVFEAMSCGLPVIVSESVGATEILRNNVEALFVNPTDIDGITAEIESLMTDETRYRQIAQTAASFHEQYTWEQAYCAPMLSLLLEQKQSCTFSNTP